MFSKIFKFVFCLGLFNDFVRCSVEIIDISDLVDVNLDFFGKAYPLNKFDGTVLFDNIEFEASHFSEVKLSKISYIGRKGEVKQTVDLNEETNTIQGSLGLREATLSFAELKMVDEMYYNMSVAVVDKEINLYSSSLDVDLSMKPDSGACSLWMKTVFNVDKAFLGSGSADEMDVTRIFRDTFVRYINSNMKNVRLMTIAGGCKGVNGMNVLKRGIQMFQTNNIAQSEHEKWEKYRL